MSKEFFYTAENDYLVDCPDNLTFKELHYSSEKKFQDWVTNVRKRIRSSWNRTQTPPTLGTRTTNTIVSDLKNLSVKNTKDMARVDDLTHRKDCITSKGTEGSSCNNFFPTMWMTTDASSGHGIADILFDKDKEEICRGSFRRHFKRDSFRMYSKFAKTGDTTIGSPKTGKEWIHRFIDDQPPEYIHYDFWLEVQKSRTGSKGKLTISKKDIKELEKKGYIRKNQIKSIETKDSKNNTYKYGDLTNNQRFYIRYFDGKKRVFPDGYKIFGVGFRVIQATNFPPLVAKHIYTRFTEKIKKQERIVIYDPSLGWGGRILGCCSAGADRRIHYVGTDPNPDNFIPDLGISRYEYVANFFQRNVPQHNHITFDLFQCGSEEIHKEKRFQKYKGEVDLVFTSPPYFNAEGYSPDDNQSSVKFPEYDQWRDGFLRPTLETAVEYLKEGGHLLWNIADVKEGNFMLPLESDTVEILEELGMKYETKLKFVLGRTPGASRVSKVHRNPTAKNFVSIGGDWRKYEPVFCFRKTSRTPKVSRRRGQDTSGQKERTKVIENRVSKYGVQKLTPVQEPFHNLFYKRDDLFRPFGKENVNGGKVRQSLCLVAENLDDIRKVHSKTIITQSSVDSPQGAIVANVAKEFGLRCIVCVGGSRKHTIYNHTQMKLVKHFGGEVRIVAGHGMPTAINARINEINNKENWFNIGFGMNVETSYWSLIETTANQVKNLPDRLDYLVISVGSGLQMAGILKGINRYNKRIGQIVGVQVGPSRRKKIDGLLGGLQMEYDLIPPIAPYAKYFEDEYIGSGRTAVDPVYEGKAHYWMWNDLITHYKEKKKHPRICFWVVGRRLEG